MARERPTTIRCPDCGRDAPVSASGPIPDRCSDCREVVRLLDSIERLIAPAVETPVRGPQRYESGPRRGEVIVPHRLTEARAAEVARRLYRLAWRVLAAYGLTARARAMAKNQGGA